MEPLEIVASITSDQTHDPDDVPTYEGGNCRYYGAWKDSPVPNVRTFVVFNREPQNDDEAIKLVREQIGGGEDEEDNDEDNGEGDDD